MTDAECVTDSEGDAMMVAIEEARQAAATPGKAGIGAVVMWEGRIVATASNHVHLDPDPTQHAEIVALGRAAKKLGRADLSGCVLLSTLQPCEMCLAAARFAGIDRIIFAARQENVAKKYFVFPHLGIEDFQGADKLSFTAIGGVQEKEVLHYYADGAE